MLITTLSSPGRTVSYWIRILGNSIPLMNWSHPDNGMKRPVASLGSCLSPLLSHSLGLSWAWLMACPFPLSASFLVLLAQPSMSSLFTWPHVGHRSYWVCLPSIPLPLNWLRLNYCTHVVNGHRVSNCFQMFTRLQLCSLGEPRQCP